MQTLEQTDVAGKNILVRVDFDILFDQQGNIVSDFRIKAALPTIKYLKKNGAARIVLIAHLGRPVTRPGAKIEELRRGNPLLTMQPIARHLKELLKTNTSVISEKNLGDSPLPAYIIGRDLYLLENIRFDWREERDDPALATALAQLGEIFVYDAFAVAHRRHTSTHKVMELLPAVAGLHLIKELNALAKLSNDILHPYIMVLGGAKVSDKLPIIKRFADSVDQFLIGGAMANTFLTAQGTDVKNSLIEKELIGEAKELLERFPNKFVLPTDHIWQQQKILDIGPQTRQRFAQIIASAKTAFWNGTLGLTSATAQEFKAGSLEIAQSLGKSQAYTIVAGGDTVGFLEEQNISFNDYDFVSTGGGAALEFLAEKRLPALEALGYYNE